MGTRERSQQTTRPGQKRKQDQKNRGQRKSKNGDVGRAAGGRRLVVDHRLLLLGRFKTGPAPTRRRSRPYPTLPYPTLPYLRQAQPARQEGDGDEASPHPHQGPQHAGAASDPQGLERHSFSRRSSSTPALAEEVGVGWGGGEGESGQRQS